MSRDFVSHWTAFDSASANSSTFTSAPVRVDSFTRLTASVDTTQAVASLYTFQGSIDPSATTFYTYALMSARGLADLSTNTTPPLWLRVQRSSLDSMAIVWLLGRCP